MSTPSLAEARRSLREQGDFQPLLELVPYARFLDIRVIPRGNEWITHLPFRDGLIGNTALRALHGGVTGSFMENAAVLHLLMHEEETRVPRSIDFAIDYLQPALSTDTYAACEVTRSGLRIAQIQIRCWQQRETHPIAVARAHFMLKPQA